MESSDDTRLIAKITQPYCKQDTTQAQITHELRIYRTTISRLLKRGCDQGIVTTAINYDYNENLWLEQQLKQKFGLEDVMMVSGSDKDERTQLAMMGLHGVQLLDRLLEPGDIVGSSRGCTVGALVENLPQAGQSRQLIYVPIIGKPSDRLEGRCHVNTLTYSAATKLKEELRLADFLALLDNLLTRNGTMQSQHSKTISAHRDNLGVALVGTGSPVTRDDVSWHTSCGSKKSGDLNAHQVADDICSRFFDVHGATVETSTSEKTLPIEMNGLKQARYSIDVTMSEEKYSGIIGTLRGEHINCLITNSSTAKLLLK